MTGTRRMIRQTLTVARRDFLATVFTPTFLIFLLAPLIMISFSAIGGLGASTVAKSSGDKLRIVAIIAADDAAAITGADKQLRTLYRGEEDAPPALAIKTPDGPGKAQAQALFGEDAQETTAILYGPLDAPQVLFKDPSERHAKYLASLADAVMRDRALAGRTPLSTPDIRQFKAAEQGSTASGRSQAAFFTVLALFFVTLLLASQTVGTMAEERSNKVIEVLAAAVPLESVFLGKLIGMFGVALLFIAFWGTVAINIVRILPASAAQTVADVGPAMGSGVFAILFVAYFTMNFLLLGAVFLGVGAQASTPREIQMLSLPITILQMAMFGLASAAAANPDAWYAEFARIFPFSSPLAMAARAATSTILWPHLAAIAWQLLWVTITITLSARAFRRGVLQSAGPKSRWKAVFARK